jgi:hypothetical protein
MVNSSLSSYLDDPSKSKDEKEIEKKFKEYIKYIDIEEVHEESLKNIIKEDITLVFDEIQNANEIHVSYIENIENNTLFIVDNKVMKLDGNDNIDIRINDSYKNIVEKVIKLGKFLTTKNLITLKINVKYLSNLENSQKLYNNLLEYINIISLIVNSEEKTINLDLDFDSMPDSKIFSEWFVQQFVCLKKIKKLSITNYLPGNNNDVSSLLKIMTYLKIESVYIEESRAVNGDALNYDKITIKTTEVLDDFFIKLSETSAIERLVELNLHTTSFNKNPFLECMKNPKNKIQKLLLPSTISLNEICDIIYVNNHLSKISYLLINSIGLSDENFMYNKIIDLLEQKKIAFEVFIFPESETTPKNKNENIVSFVNKLFSSRIKSLTVNYYDKDGFDPIFTEENFNKFLESISFNEHIEYLNLNNFFAGHNDFNNFGLGINIKELHLENLNFDTNNNTTFIDKLNIHLQSNKSNLEVLNLNRYLPVQLSFDSLPVAFFKLKELYINCLMLNTIIETTVSEEGLSKESSIEDKLLPEYYDEYNDINLFSAIKKGVKDLPKTAVNAVTSGIGAAASAAGITSKNLGYDELSSKKKCIGFQMKKLQLYGINYEIFTKLLMCNNIEYIYIQSENETDPKKRISNEFINTFFKSKLFSNTQIEYSDSLKYNSSLLYSNFMPLFYTELNKIYNFFVINRRSEEFSRIELYDIKSSIYDCIKLIMDNSRVNSFNVTNQQTKIRFLNLLKNHLCYINNEKDPDFTDQPRELNKDEILNKYIMISEINLTELTQYLNNSNIKSKFQKFFNQTYEKVVYKYVGFGVYEDEDGDLWISNNVKGKTPIIPNKKYNPNSTIGRVFSNAFQNYNKKSNPMLMIFDKADINRVLGNTKYSDEKTNKISENLLKDSTSLSGNLISKKNQLIDYNSTLIPSFAISKVLQFGDTVLNEGAENLFDA